MFDNEYVLDIWRFQWLFGMGILVYKMQKLISTEINSISCFKSFYFNIPSPHCDLEVCIFYVVTFWKQPLCISGFSPGTLRQYSSGSDGARTEEPHPWDRLLACFMSTSVWDTWRKSEGLCPERRFHFLISHYLSFPGETGMLRTWKWFGGQGKEE